MHADLGRARDARALDDREPDGAAPITATRAPAQTRAVSSTDITPVATAQPIRHACSTGSSRGTHDDRLLGDDRPRRERSGAQDGRQLGAVPPVQPARRGRRAPALPRLAAHARRAGSARGLPADHDAVAGRDRA